MHIVLLGDSIFDNGAYVGDGPDVIAQLRGLLPAGTVASLRAVDGHTASEVFGQLARVPRDATHLVVSAGGNDALSNIGLLSARAATVGEGLVLLSLVVEEFVRRYGAMLEAVRARGHRVVVCSVYDPRFADATIQRAATTALAVFNAEILRAAFGRGIPVVDLRGVMTDPDDYANDIEPAARGGAKIARAVLSAVQLHDFDSGRAAVFTS